MTRVYSELSPIIALTNQFDVFHIETVRSLREVRLRGFEAVSCRQAVEMDLAIGVARRPLRVADAMRILEAIDFHGLKLLDAQPRMLLSLVGEYLKEVQLSIGDLLHYAGAALLRVEYLASWNTDDFNPRIEEAINRVNRKRKLETIKVGTPTQIMEWMS